VDLFLNLIKKSYLQKSLKKLKAIVVERLGYE